MKTIVNADCLIHLRTLHADSMDSLVTDPPAGISFMGKDWDGNRGGRDAWIDWMSEIGKECLRVLKPGAHGLVWAIPRTSHWTAFALEKAGFEIRDIVHHLFGSGFPKASALDREKSGVFCRCASDKHSSENKEALPALPDHKSNSAASLCGDLQPSGVPHSNHKLEGSQVYYPGYHDSHDEPVHSCSDGGLAFSQQPKYALEHSRSAEPLGDQASEPLHSPFQVQHIVPPSSLGYSPHEMLSQNIGDCRTSYCGALSQRDTAQTLSDNNHIEPKQQAFPPSCEICGKPNPKGWYNGGLKPASEHWILIRKPLGEKTVAKNVLKWSTGGINIDASRISVQKDGPVPPSLGRFPSNLILSHHPDCMEVRKQCHPACAVSELDRQSGVSKSSGGKKGASSSFKLTNGDRIVSANVGGLGDTGGASRFFYCAKASKRDRNEGLEGMPEKTVSHMITGSGKPSGSVQERSAEGQPNRFTASHQNHHPTVKSTKLMSYLITLVTPPGGTVLDPFMGSGSTGVAALKGGFKFTGIEMDEAYFEIAKRRLENV